MPVVLVVWSVSVSVSVYLPSVGPKTFGDLGSAVLKTLTLVATAWESPPGLWDGSLLSETFRAPAVTDDGEALQSNPHGIRSARAFVVQQSSRATVRVRMSVARFIESRSFPIRGC